MSRNGFKKQRSYFRIGVQLVSAIGLIVAGAFIPDAIKGDGWPLRILVFAALLMFAALPYIYEKFGKDSARTYDDLKTFTGTMPRIIRPLNDYIVSDMTIESAERMRKSLAAQSASALGNGARVCVYKFIQKEEDGEEEGAFVLDQVEGRPGDPRRMFDHSTVEGTQFVQEVLKGKEVVVSDINKPPRNMRAINPNPLNDYGSFVLIPVLGISKKKGDERKVKGVLSIDFPEKKTFYFHHRYMLLCIAHMFEVGFQSVKRGGEETNDVAPRLYLELKKMRESKDLGEE